jgi:hypothetical protein
MNTTEHLLTCLGEEGCEVAQDVAKALRFGLDDRNVLNPTGPTNRERIVAELNDLAAVIEMLVMRGVIPKDWPNPAALKAKQQKVEKFLDYARSVGALSDNIRS